MLAAAHPADVLDRSGAPVTIHRATAEDENDWNAYVDEHPKGGFFHLFGWGEIIDTAYGYEPIFLAAKRGEKIVGILPLIDVKAPLLGRSLISTAFTVGGGPIGDDEEVITSLAAAAVDEGEKRNVKYVEFRSDVGEQRGWHRKSGIYASFRTDIPACGDSHFKRLKRSRRRAVRKALAAIDEGVLREGVELDPEHFYQVYARSLREHGTPVFSKEFLADLIRVFEPYVELSFTEAEGKTAGALLSFYFKDAVMPYYFGATSAGRDVHAQEYQYWSLMRRAAEKGVRIFDFGRSKVGSGPYTFKKLWDIEPTPLVYQYKLIKAAETPNINPNNPKFAAFVQAWRRLPVPVANAAGPLLARNFP